MEMSGWVLARQNDTMGLEGEVSCSSSSSSSSSIRRRSVMRRRSSSSSSSMMMRRSDCYVRYMSTADSQ